eukprot:7319950-Alexandrium_andersonii.AAC.1
MSRLPSTSSRAMDHSWPRPPLLAGEVDYSRDLCKRFQARLCTDAECRYYHVCAVCGAQGHG